MDSKRVQGAVIRKADIRSGRVLYGGRLPGSLATQEQAQCYAGCCGHGLTEVWAAGMEWTRSVRGSWPG